MGSPDVPAAPLPPPLPPTPQSPEMEAIRRRARAVALASSGWRSTVLSRATIGGPGYGSGGTGGGTPRTPPPERQPYGGATCVAPESPIDLWDGGTKRADEVTIGDSLRGIDPDSGEELEVKLTNLLIVADQERWVVHVEMLDLPMLVSATHLFWVVDKGWTKTLDLLPGDILGGPAGGLVEQVEPYDRGTVIGFTVTEPHTFCIDGVLSHNKSKQGY